MNISQLLARLIEANDAYRNGTPIMSDGKYDVLEEQLRRALAIASGGFPNANVPQPWEEAKAFLASIGHKPSGAFKKVVHAVAMTSLLKLKNPVEFDAWFSGLQPGTKLVTDKLDGLSVDLKYVNGELEQAATRGNGEVGEDITRNVVKMTGVVLTGLEFQGKPYTGHIRGEIIMLRSTFTAKYAGESNCRNTAVGKAKSRDGEGAEDCTVFVYQAVPPISDSKYTTLCELKGKGFIVPKFYSFPGAGISVLYQKYIDGIRASLDYDIDGLVIEFDSFATMEALGEQDHRPAGARAFKFPSDSESTQLLNIIWQVGKSGRITPVAEVQPVQLAGATVSRVSLHNLDIIRALTDDAGLTVRAGTTGLVRGMEVLVSRRNDVIPYLEEILQVPSGMSEFLIAKECPSCNAPLSMVGAYLMCTNHEECPAQVVGAISRWVKKIGVIGVGDAFIEAMVEHAGVEDAADLYTLDASSVQNIQVGGSKLGRSAEIALEALHRVKELPLHIFVGALGIPLCARSVCKTIVDAGYDTLDKMERATVDEIEAIPGLGNTKADSFVKGLFSKMALIDRLQDVGVKIKPPATGQFDGQSFCFTGIRDPALERAIEAQGGSIKSSVGKGLTYLVMRDPNSTSEKAEKAKKLGTLLLGVEEARKRAGL